MILQRANLFVICLIVFALFCDMKVTYAYGREEIIAVLNDGKVGEQSQLKGIAQAIIDNNITKSISYVSNNNYRELVTLTEKICNDKKPALLLTSGTDGIEITNKLYRPSCSNLKILNSSHLIYNEHYSILNKADFIVLPVHSLNNKFLTSISNSKAKVIKTIGVPHSATAQSLQQEYIKYKRDFAWLENESKVAMLILGGDVPAANKTIKLYTIEEAIHFAAVIGNYCKDKDYKLMVFNGPRTGQYDQKTLTRNNNVHQGQSLDPVTDAFMFALQQYLPSSWVRLYDFSYNGSTPYKAGLWIIKTVKDGKCFVPGESTSMISEVVDTLPGRTVIVQNGAMTEEHTKHTLSEMLAGRAIVVNKDLYVLPVNESQGDKISMPKSAAQHIVDVVFKGYKSAHKI